MSLKKDDFHQIFFCLENITLYVAPPKTGPINLGNLLFYINCNLHFIRTYCENISKVVCAVSKKSGKYISQFDVALLQCTIVHTLNKSKVPFWRHSDFTRQPLVALWHCFLFLNEELCSHLCLTLILSKIMSRKWQESLVIRRKIVFLRLHAQWQQKCLGQCKQQKLLLHFPNIIAKTYAYELKI